MTGRCALVAKEYIKVEDQVRDVMLLTLPGLKADGEDISVDPDLLMEDDGMDGVFFEAFIRDEIPRMDLRHEVRDLMILAEPSLAAYEEAGVEDECIPDDSTEIDWSEPGAEEVPETADAVLAIAPVQAVPAIAPAAAPLAIAAAESCEALAAPVTMALPMPEEVPAIAEAAPVEEPVAEVPQAPKIWRVCFSF